MSQKQPNAPETFKLKKEKDSRGSMPADPPKLPRLNFGDGYGPVSPISL